MKLAENTWDYVKGDLIEVKHTGWLPTIGIVVRQIPSVTGRDYWDWITSSGEQRTFFKANPPMDLDVKITLLARSAQENKKTARNHKGFHEKD